MVIPIGHRVVHVNLIYFLKNYTHIWTCHHSFYGNTGRYYSLHYFAFDLVELCTVYSHWFSSLSEFVLALSKYRKWSWISTEKCDWMADYNNNYYLCYYYYLLFIFIIILLIIIIIIIIILVHVMCDAIINQYFLFISVVQISSFQWFSLLIQRDFYGGSVRVWWYRFSFSVFLSDVWKCRPL